MNLLCVVTPSPSVKYQVSPSAPDAMPGQILERHACLTQFVSSSCMRRSAIGLSPSWFLFRPVMPRPCCSPNPQSLAIASAMIIRPFVRVALQMHEQTQNAAVAAPSLPIAGRPLRRACDHITDPPENHDTRQLANLARQNRR